MWPIENLEKLIETDPIFNSVINAAVGIDIAKKLFSNDSIRIALEKHTASTSAASRDGDIQKDFYEIKKTSEQYGRVSVLMCACPLCVCVCVL